MHIFDMQYYYHKNIFQWLIVLSCVVIIISDNYKAAFGCLEEEKIGLLKLKDVINHHNRSVPSTWSDYELDCCKWEGVICSDGRIINLTLITSDNNPSHIYNVWKPDEWLFVLDASLFQPFEELQKLNFSGGVFQGVKGPLRLPKLQVLDLNNNSISDDGFLQGLSNLTSLEFLNLDFSINTGKIPPSIWALTSLKVLGLSINGLDGSFPEGICRLINLEELDLSGNAFEGVIPTCLSNLTSLRLLDLSTNFFNGSIPSNLFSNLKSLEYISLSFNYFVGLVPFSSFANNSNLEVFDLQLDDNVPKLKVNTEITQLEFPLFQLKVFILSNCILNEPTGGIPRFLLSQYDLRIVDLDNIGMTGELPSWLISNNSKLESLGLRNNYFTGKLLLQSDAYRGDMGWLDVSGNQMVGEIPTFIGSVLPNLFHLDMSTNDINGSFPSSIENMKKLEVLDLSNNHLFGEFHGDLFNGCKELVILKLSKNKLGGNLTNFLPNILQLPKLLNLYLDSNNFYGDLQLQTLHFAHDAPLRLLDIGNNLITGRFPDWIAELTNLYTLVLSKNQFEGELPVSFCNLSSKLTYLDLSSNNFSDFLPPCSNLPSLMFLHLQGNGFSGPLPTPFNRSSIIWTLDVRYNKFSGLIPSWIGSLSRLSNLLLKGNRFHGSLPLDLCQLKNLNVLDLSANNLSGLIPTCLFHIPFDFDRPVYSLTDAVDWQNSGPAPKYSYKRNLHVNQQSFSILYWVYNVENEVQLTTKSRSALYKGDIVQEVFGIDLSLNKFTGQIPLDFGKLEMLSILNLSNNHLNGSIPWTLCGLTNLESLDLSHNMLSGKIPSEITKLTYLSVFSVAYNNLSGPTPTMTNQFISFDASSYEGNPLLCGFPLDISCSNRSTMPLHAKPSVELEQKDTSYETAFLWSFFGSFVVSCIGAFLFFYFGTNVPQIILEWLGFEDRVLRRRIVELSWMWNK